jgi:nicotinamidase/pyrazinamidase
VFSTISNADVVSKRWNPIDPKLLQYCEEYTYQLEEKGRFQLTIWPNHCIIGSPGNDVVPCLKTAISSWAGRARSVQYVRKGQNNLTEMYSAVEAEVPIPADPFTQTNYALLGDLKRADKVIIAGQALSHCVNYTTRDILKYWAPRDPRDLILLLDGCSPVAGCEADAEKFVVDMRAAGVTLALSTTVFAEL